MADTRYCIRCEKTKDITAFYTNNKYIVNVCRDCNRIYQRAYYHTKVNNDRYKQAHKTRRANDPDFVAKVIKRNKEFYASTRGRALTLVKGAQRRAKSRGELCTVTLDFVMKALDIGYCPVTKIPFVIVSGQRAKGGMHPFAPSLDRIDCAQPYSDINARVVIWQYNMMKGNLSDLELYYICEAVIRNHGNSNL